MNNFKLKTIIDLPFYVKKTVGIRHLGSTRNLFGKFELKEKDKMIVYEKTEDKKKIYVITTNPLFDKTIFYSSRFLARENKYLCSFDILIENMPVLILELEPDKIYDISFTDKEKHLSFIIKEKHL